MNNLGIIKWIISLQERDRLTAVLLIFASTLWVQNKLDKHAYNDLQDKYRIELINRTDSCDSEKERINRLNYGYLLRAQYIMDSLTNANSSIINQNNKAAK